jgi:alpha-beta hydrolase superfamily lysophospholipase
MVELGVTLKSNLRPSGEQQMDPKSFSWETQDKITLVGQTWKTTKKEKAVIILVHGLGEHALRYQHMAEFYNDVGISVVSFDLRGHGRSDGVRGHATSYDAICDDIQTLVDGTKERFPNIPMFIFGHSLGGALVLYYLLKRKPELRGAIVTSPALASGDPVPPVKMLAARVMTKLAPSFSMPNGLDRSGLSRDPEVEKKYSSDPNVHGMISARLGWELISNGQFILDHGNELKLPMLLMQGSADRVVDVQKTIELSKKVPATTTFKLWDGFYHELHNEPEKLEVLNFELNWLNKQM